jgi:hypothetical protein
MFFGYFIANMYVLFNSVSYKTKASLMKAQDLPHLLTK